MTVRLKHVLDKRVKKLKGYERIKEIKIMEAWKKICGGQIAKQTKAAKFRHGKLQVMVSSSVWAHQLAFFRKDYIRKINTHLEEKIVKDIHFKVGNLRYEEEISINREEKEDQTPEWRKIDPNKDTIQKIHSLASTIDNDELRNIFERVMVSDAKLRSWRKENGWISCEECGASLKKRPCQVCASTETEKGKERKLKQIIENEPWTSFDKIKKDFPALSLKEYQRIRQEVAVRVKSDLENEMLACPENDHKNEAFQYVLVVSGLHPGYVNHDIMQDVLGEKLFKEIFK